MDFPQKLLRYFADFFFSFNAISVRASFLMVQKVDKCLAELKIIDLLQDFRTKRFWPLEHLKYLENIDRIHM